MKRMMTVAVAVLCVVAGGIARAEQVAGVVAAHDIRIDQLETQFKGLKESLAALTGKVDTEQFVDAVEMKIQTLKNELANGDAVQVGRINALQKDILLLQARVQEESLSIVQLDTIETIAGYGVERLPGLPGEATVRDLTRPGCPDGTAPKYRKVGVDEKFSCQPIEVNRAKKALRYLMAGSLGAGAGVVGNYGLGRTLNHDMTGKDLVMSGVGGAVIGILVYYLAE